jgi:ribosomal protein L19
MINEAILDKIRPGAKIKVFSAVAVSSAPAGKGKSKGKEASAKAEASTSIFEGVVISRKHGKEAGGTFTVRRILAGVGVEKIFPINTPTISKVEIISSPKKVHRSKLYFVRDVSSKKIRQKLGVSL